MINIYIIYLRSNRGPRSIQYFLLNLGILWIQLQHFVANIYGLYKSFGLEIIECQTEANNWIGFVLHLPRKLVAIRSISVGLFLFILNYVNYHFGKAFYLSSIH